MGDRGQVYIKDEGVYLYTHWGATDLVNDVRRALAKRWRWYDSEYLARIIFDEMVPIEERGEETGFGIGRSKHGDVWRLITIDVKNQTVTVQDYDEPPKKYSFEQFVNLHKKGKSKGKSVRVRGYARKKR